MSEPNKPADGANSAAAVAAPALGLVGGLGVLIGAAAASGSVVGVAVTLALAATASGLVALVGRALQASQARRPMVFVSYARENGAEARVLLDAIRRTGARTWLDFENVRPGESLNDAILAAVQAADVVLVMAGDEPQGRWAALEVDAAKRLGKPLLFAQVKHHGDAGGSASVKLGNAEGIEAVASEVVGEAVRAKAAGR